MSTYVKDTTLTFTPSQLLVLTDALRLLINSPVKHPVDKQEAERIIDRIYEKVDSMDIGIDFTENEIKAIELVSGWKIPDDADMRHAIHDMVTELARLKDINISDIDLEEGVGNW